MILSVLLAGCSDLIPQNRGNPGAPTETAAPPSDIAGGSEDADGDSGPFGEESSAHYEDRGNAPAFTFPLGGRTVDVYPHPRIWVTPVLLDRLAEKAVVTNPMWAGLKTYNDAGIGSNSYVDDASAGPLCAFAAGYLATGNAAYFQAARTVLLNFTDPALYDISCDGSAYCGNDNLDYGSIDLMYIAAAYDWLANDLSAADRSAVADWVFDDLIPFLRLHPYHYYYGAYGDEVHNLGHTKWGGEFLWALASLGDDVRAESLLRGTYEFWTEDILPLLDEVFPGGHTYSGSGYGYNRVFKYQLYALEAAFTAIDLRMYEERSWPIDGIEYRVHSMLPGGEYFHSDWEAAAAFDNQGRMTENEAILAHRFRDSFGGRIAQHYVHNVYRPRAVWGDGGNRVNPIYMGRWFLWYDPDLPAEDYTQALPPAYRAEGLGLFMTRSRWNDPDAAFASLSAAAYVGDHQLHNEGSFKIFSREYLAIENGPMYSGQDSNTTPPHCNILFIGDGKVEYGQLTGGMYRRTTGSLANIDRFLVSETSGLAYARADLTTAYHPGFFPLDYFQRSFVHLRDGNGRDYFVLFDRIRSQNAETKKTFLHLVETPAIDGDTASIVSTNGLSKLFVRNLLPAESSFSVETVADRTTGGITQESSDNPTRLVLTHSEGAGLEARFLTVLTAVNGLSVGQAPEERVESEDSAWLGAFVDDETVGRMVLFSKTGSPHSGTISYTLTTSGPVRHAVFDLEPGSAFDVGAETTASELRITLSGNPGGALSANDQGVLLFATD